MEKFILIFILISLNGYGQNRNNENIREKEFSSFKEKLETCVAKKDKTALKELLYDRILDCWDAFDCAGWSGCNKENFINIFFYDSTSPHWDIMSDLLQQGFEKIKDTSQYQHIKHSRDPYIFVAPAYTSKLKNSNSIMVLTDKTSLQEKPSITAGTIKTIPYGLYVYEADEYGSPKVYDSGNETWIKLVLKDGTQGYVDLKHTSESISRQLKVSKIQGKWLITGYYCLMSI